MNFLKFLVALTVSLILTDLAPAQSESAQGAEDGGGGRDPARGEGGHVPRA